MHIKILKFYCQLVLRLYFPSNSITTSYIYVLNEKKNETAKTSKNKNPSRVET